MSMPNLAGLGLPGQMGTPTAQDRQAAFLNAAVDRRTVAADRVLAPASPYVLQAGAVISAALITGFRSDLPGQITAQVTEHVYDSPTGASCSSRRVRASSAIQQRCRLRATPCPARLESADLPDWPLRSFSSASRAPTRRAMPVLRMASTITGGI
jgi:hypothetical protein